MSPGPPAGCLAHQLVSPLGDSLKNRLYAGDASASRELEAFQLSPGESGDSGGGDMRGDVFVGIA